MAHPYKSMCKGGPTTARHRYAEGGGVPPIKIIPTGVSGLPEKDAASWSRRTALRNLNNIYVKGPSTSGGRAGYGPSLHEEKKRGGSVKKKAEGGNIQPLPMEPKGSLARLGQDRYRLETKRDSVTGRLRTSGEGRGLSTTRTDKE